MVPRPSLVDISELGVLAAEQVNVFAIQTMITLAFCSDLIFPEHV